MQLHAIITRENEMFVALCPELDIASQGYSVDEAKANLREAIEGVFEVASPTEIERLLRLGAQVSPLQMEIAA